MADGVGIDLGTTHCCVYVQRPNRVAQLVKNKEGDNTTPSWVRYEENGITVVGKSAKKQSPKKANSTIRNAKRLIGRGYSDPAVQSEIQRMPFKIFEDSGVPVIQAKGLSAEGNSEWKKNIRPEEVSATLLSSLREGARQFLGTPVSKAVITVPANFKEHQKSATVKAATLAGFSDVNLLHEPTAAAIAYGEMLNEQCTVMVFDFGGGTLDITIMEVIARKKYKVLTTDGDMYLGGEDFDNEIVKYFLSDIKAKHNRDFSKDSKILATLKLVAEEAKIALSVPNAQIYRDSIDALESVLGREYEAVLTKTSFDSMFGSLLENIIKPVKRALESIDYSPADISKVIMVGGSSKLPAVRHHLGRFFGRDDIVCADVNPDEMIARGAAMQSYLLNNNLSITVQETTPFYYGLKQYDGSISVLIPIRTEYPCSFTKVFVTAKDDQTGVSFKIFQSKCGFALDKYQIGRFDISNLPARKKGECKFDVTFEINANNLLHVTAQGKGTIAHCKDKIVIDVKPTY
ncbi:heat shock 70 kDa protein C-like [Paramacrobiotus metropolitanus]|uniref:heat shock 70 kDa protein C-like n=1 Tax=Paramacrobiotus metropolitanus TaxID=2943436 RepID=UPI002445956C|nr:heat shock 70 kDa protein C-like [Paramacrobiotus metropolitanus]